MRGDYSRGTKFLMAASRFVNVTQDVINAIEENTILRKGAAKLGVSQTKDMTFLFYLVK